MNASLTCPRCTTPLPAVQLDAFAPCANCTAPLLIRAFPALAQPVAAGVTSERITEAGQAGCFYHPTKTAHVPCDSCGRFVCALCDVELHGQHLCPSCLESGRRKGSLTMLENKRVLWDNLALGTTVLPVVTLLFWFLSIVTAPAAIILALVGWRKPRSLVPRWTELRFIIAIILSVAILLGWVVVFTMLATGGFDE